MELQIGAMEDTAGDDAYEGCYTTQSSSDKTIKEYESLAGVASEPTSTQEEITPKENATTTQKEFEPEQSNSVVKEAQKDIEKEEEEDKEEKEVEVAFPEKQKSNKAAETRRYNSRRPEICTRNAVQVLNEMHSSLNYMFVREIEYGNCEKLFTISVELEGEVYEGTARNKKEAKQEAAKKALLKCYNILCVPDRQSQGRFRSFGGQETKMGAALDPNLGPYYSSKNPVMQLHELHKDTEYLLVGEGYANKAERYFVMAANVCGYYFEASARNKKTAKAEVARMALEYIYNIHIVPEAEMPEDGEFLLSDKGYLGLTGTSSKRKASDKAVIDMENFKYCPDKNALTQLSEIRPYLDFEYIGNIGSLERPWYRFTVEMDGAYYEGTANSWKCAKYNAAVAALKALESYSKYEKRKNIQSKEPDNKKLKTETETQESSTAEAVDNEEDVAVDNEEDEAMENEEVEAVENEEDEANDSQNTELS